MNAYTYDTYFIRSKFLSKIEFIYKQIFIENNYYIKNLKDFIEIYADDNKCNITNNNLINKLITEIDNWYFLNEYTKKLIYENMSTFIYNCDMDDKEMMVFIKQFINII